MATYIMNQQYHKELSKFSPMQKIEFQQQLTKYRQGDKIAGERIIKSYLKLVVFIAKKYNNMIADSTIIELDDLISEGNIALTISLNNYDEKAGVEFSNYVSTAIKNSIIKYIANNISLIRIPHRRARKYREIQQAIEQLKINNEEEISNENSNYTEKEISDFNYNNLQINNEYVVDVYEDKEEDNTDMIDRIKKALIHLTTKERIVIKGYFGIDQEQKSLTKMGEEMGCTKSALSTIKKKALEKIKVYYSL